MMKDDGVSPLSTGLLLPDAVKHVCEEGLGLRWDVDASCYEVVDGALFEKRFDELRRKRDRDDGSSGRPFSRMHKYYKLEAGERWAKTGARFSPKSPLLLRNLQAAHAPTRPEGFDIYAPIFDESKIIEDSKSIGAYDIYGHDPNNLTSISAQELGTKRQRLPDLKGDSNNYIRDFSNAQITESSTTGADMRNGMDRGTDEHKHIFDAENIKVRLHTRAHLPHVSDTMEVSLQHFLDTVNAGGQYFEAMKGRSLQSPDYSTESSSPQMDTDAGSPDGLEYAFEQQGDLRVSSTGVPQHGVPRAVKSMDDDAPPAMDRMDSADLFGEIMRPGDRRESLGDMGAWGMWSEASKGDQAYFFPRTAQMTPFFNGSIVALRDGVLVPADNLQSTDIFLVVSDKNAKWKGEPHPPKDQEHLGHWCAYLGQVPLQVAGPVKAGSYLGPVGDGSGLACVVRPGEGPVVGIALAAKDGAETGVVKAMVSVGLNALSVPMETQRDQREEVLRRVEKVSERVGALAEQARAAKEQAARAVVVAERTEGKVNGLQHRVDGIEEEVQKVRMQQKQAELQQEHVEPVLSQRQYLWSCFCGLFSITVTEQTAAASSRPQPAKPQSLALQVGNTCLKYFDNLMSDTIVNLAMTCVLLNVAHLFGAGFVFDVVVHECFEAVFHGAFLVWFLRPGYMITKFSYYSLKQDLKLRAEADGTQPKPPLRVPCPIVIMSSNRKLFVLLFWYAVAAHIVWHSIHVYKTMAPFGYAYLMVLTFKMVFQVAARSVLPVKVEDIEA